jgi:hypothetical protein
VRLLKLDSPRPVGMEIVEGYKGWVDDSNARQHRKLSMAYSIHFKQVASNWLRFQGFLLTTPKPVPSFANFLSEFLNAMHSRRGPSLETLQSYRSKISAFLPSSSIKPLRMRQRMASELQGWTD